MKKIIISGFILAIFTLFYACDPNEFDKGELNVNTAPTSDEMVITVADGVDDFHFVLSNLTDMSGIYTAKWDFGNGSTGTGDEVTAYYALPDTYTITLTITAADGTSASKSTTITTTETDYSIYEDEKYTFISGGVSASEGKTWKMDSLTYGHIGVGESIDNALGWWGASALGKSGVGMYDDEITFTLDGFAFNYENNGQSYVKSFQTSNSYYSNATEIDGDWRVDYADPAPGTWFIDGDYLQINSSAGNPLFPIFDVGAVDGLYKIQSLTETNMELSCTGGDGNGWYIKLVLKDYVAPVVTYDVTVAETGEENTWAVSLTNVVIPSGVTVDGFTVDFGDGGAVVTVDDYTGSAEYTYMRKGTFTVTVTVLNSYEDVEATTSITVDQYHSDYEEFLLDMMVMYVDNSEVELAPVYGQDCSVAQVDNPEAIYPNKGSKVFQYTKEYNQWANAYMELSAGYRFNLTLTSTFKMYVRGKAGDVVLLKLENTDKAEAYKTGSELTYTIQADDTWEIAEYNFAGVGAGWDGTGDQFTSDITTDDRFNQDFYNVIRIMYNPGDNSDIYSFYFDDLAGPHVEGTKSATIK
jgi:hypothetical protein